MRNLNKLFEEVLKETESKREYEIIQDGSNYDKLVIKDEFSFYQARYVYRDPYIQKCTVKTKYPDGFSVVGTVYKNNEKPMIVLQGKIEGKDEEGDPKIRIYSAIYAGYKTQVAYFQRAT